MAAFEARCVDDRVERPFCTAAVTALQRFGRRAKVRPWLTFAGRSPVVRRDVTEQQLAKVRMGGRRLSLPFEPVEHNDYAFAGARTCAIRALTSRRTSVTGNRFASGKRTVPLAVS